MQINANAQRQESQESKSKIPTQNQTNQINAMTLSASTTSSRWLLSALLLKSTLPIISANDEESSSSSGVIPTISSLSSLPYDANARLSTHVLAFPSRCIDALSDPRIPDGIFHHAFYALEDDALHDVFGHLNLEDGETLKCAAVCLEKGTLETVVKRPLPHRYWVDGTVDQDGDGRRVDDMTFMDFVFSDGCGKVEYGMVNYHENVSFLYI